MASLHGLKYPWNLKHDARLHIGKGVFIIHHISPKTDHHFLVMRIHTHEPDLADSHTVNIPLELSTFHQRQIIAIWSCVPTRTNQILASFTL